MRFCLGCGSALAGCADGSPKAERELAVRDPGAYTPKHLADKILQSRSALEGERKQVTVLFADVKRSMELAEQLDPEEWHRTLDRFFAILTDGVHRFEGTVNQYTGDGIMALFGAPIAHEDHAQRACYAALHLRDELKRYANELRLSRGIDFSVRMGINSGAVVVGKIGDDLRMDYAIQPTNGYRRIPRSVRSSPATARSWVSCVRRRGCSAGSGAWARPRRCANERSIWRGRTARARCSPGCSCHASRWTSVSPTWPPPASTRVVRWRRERNQLRRKRACWDASRSGSTDRRHKGPCLRNLSYPT